MTTTTVKLDGGSPPCRIHRRRYQKICYLIARRGSATTCRRETILLCIRFLALFGLGALFQFLIGFCWLGRSVLRDSAVICGWRCKREDKTGELSRQGNYTHGHEVWFEHIRSFGSSIRVERCLTLPRESRRAKTINNRDAPTTLSKIKIMMNGVLVIAKRSWAGT
jgi:hypothetical protein